MKPFYLPHRFLFLICRFKKYFLLVHRYAGTSLCVFCALARISKGHVPSIWFPVPGLRRASALPGRARWVSRVTSRLSAGLCESLFLRPSCVESRSRVLTLCDPMDCSPPDSSVHGIFPGKNTRVGCHFLLQGIFPTQGSNPLFLSLLHCRQILYH